MPFDASGTFYRTGGGGGPLYNGTGANIWKGDAAASIKILASSHDIHDQDLANGLSLCILRDGKGAPTADIPWGGRKITNLAKPVSLNDAANKDYVDNPDPSEHARAIHGADLDGRLNFTAPSGVNGITWTYVDVSWVARHSEPNKTQNRLVMNNSVAPNTTGDAVGDVFIIDDTGRINNDVGMLTSNLSWDGASWRAISPGYGTKVAYKDGVFTLSSNDVATITNKYAVATQRDWLRAKNTNGNVDLDLVKSASAKYTSINSYVGTTLRWQMALGSNDAESAPRSGSSYTLKSYDNTGANAVTELWIHRDTHEAVFFGDVTSGGTVTAQQNFNSVSATCILSATGDGQIVFRPNGPADTSEQVIIDQSGGLTLTGANGVFAGAGVRGRIGQTGLYGSFYQNINWNGSVLTAYAGNSIIGNLQYVVSDYRIKKDITPLGSMWDKVKALKPIRYTQKAYDVWVNDDTPRLGFLAHELQESIDEGVVLGDKDGPDIQMLNPMAIIAGLTRALQEAMTRIEALEAAA